MATTETTTPTNEDLIRQQYAAALESTKEGITNEYNTGVSNLDAEAERNRENTIRSIAATRADAARANANRAEYEAASGLSSGARLQARTAADNQLAANITTLRAAQQASDAETERARNLLAQEYESAIKQAQSNNDAALAKALYDEAKDTEKRLRDDQLASAKIMAEYGDFSLLGKLYGWSQAQINSFNGVEENGSLTPEQVKAIQKYLGVPVTGLWDEATANAAGAGADEYYNTYIGMLENLPTGTPAPQPSTLSDNAKSFINSIPVSRSAPQYKEVARAHLEAAYEKGQLTDEEVKSIARALDLVE